MCPVWQLSDYKDGFLATAKGSEEVRRGNATWLPHVGCERSILCERDVRVVDFRQLFSLPTGYVRKRAGLAGPRLRLLPPYREHLPGVRSLLHAGRIADGHPGIPLRSVVMHGLGDQIVLVTALLAVITAGCRAIRTSPGQLRQDRLRHDARRGRDLARRPRRAEGGDLAVAEGSGVAGAVGIGDMQSMSQPRSKTSLQVGLDSGASR